MTDKNTLATIKSFAELLAAGDENERNAWVSRAKMLAMQEAKPEAFEPPIRPLGVYLEDDIPVPPVLVEPALVVRGGITCTIGRSGFGKTQLSLNRILKWSAGRPLFDNLKDKNDVTILGPSKPLRTLIIENEGAAGMFHRQMGIMLNAEGYLTAEDREQARENVLVWGDGGWSGLKLDDEQNLNLVRTGCEKWNPDIVFIEPFRGLWRGDENSATDMAVVADALSGLAADYDCAVLLCHHERKSGVGDDGEKMSAGRGSTVLEGVVATLEHHQKAKGDDFRELSWSKIRYGAGHPLLPVRMEWQPSDWWYAHVPLDKIEQSILNELADVDPEPLSISELVERTDEKVHTVRRILKALLDATPPKIKKTKAKSDGTGSTGLRYRLVIPSEEGTSLEF